MLSNSTYPKPHYASAGGRLSGWNRLSRGLLSGIKPLQQVQTYEPPHSSKSGVTKVYSMVCNKEVAEIKSSLKAYFR